MVILMSDVSDITEGAQVAITGYVGDMSRGTIHDAMTTHPQGWMASHNGM